LTKKIRIGIDVGGTFTKAVAINIADGKIVGKAAVLTTHSSREGVATGIVVALTELMQKHNIQRSNIELICHSTTQAVNALLEGDTAKVGIIGMGVAMEKSSIIRRTNIKDIELAPNKYLRTCYRFLDTSKYLQDQEVVSAISELKREGAEVLIISEAYGVDDPSNEEFVMKKSDIPATAGHELTGLYGLEVRTLTAAINAGILPKAISTAQFVESAIKKEQIAAPIMIMKGDGGVTDMKTFQSKPIITVLSGPAASVAGALLYFRVLNGVFMEIGGTSTNVCIIKDGKPEIRYVTIMQHSTCIRSLDVRVVGIAGGSLVRWSGKKITDVGPRSAHIAGLSYSCFADIEELEGGQIVTFRPKDGDPLDYVAIETGGGKRFALTNTCAANALGLIPEFDYAHSNQETAKLALSILAQRIGVTTQEAAKYILEISAKKILEILEPMLREYKLKNDNIVIIGGGGGASVLVPYLAQKLHIKYTISEHSEVVSSIGVAAAMIHEEREKTITNPKPDDASSLMEEVKQIALNRGATPESLILQSVYISERSLLRVTAVGNVNLDIGNTNVKKINYEEARKMACNLFGVSEGVHHIFEMANYHVFACEIYKKKLFLKSRKRPVLILDKFGVVRLFVENAEIIDGDPTEVADKIDFLLLNSNGKSNSNDLAPQVHILDGIKIVDFSSLAAREQVSRAVRFELEKTSSHQIIAIIKLL
jgi:N-methylhydantoinase A